MMSQKILQNNKTVSKVSIQNLQIISLFSCGKITCLETELTCYLLICNLLSCFIIISSIPVKYRKQLKTIAKYNF